MYLNLEDLLEKYTKYWKLDRIDIDWVYKLHMLGIRDIECRIFLNRYCKRDISKDSFIKFKENLRHLWQPKNTLK